MINLIRLPLKRVVNCTIHGLNFVPILETTH